MKPTRFLPLTLVLALLSMWMAVPAFAQVTPAPNDPNPMVVFMQAAADFTGHKWMALAIVVIGYLVLLTKNTSKFPINIPARFKPLVVIVLGQGYAVLEAINGGSPWKTAVSHGVWVAFGSMGIFDVIVNSIFNGKLPKWLAWLSFVDPKLTAACEAGTLQAPLVGKKTISTAPPPMPPVPPANDTKN
jgi:hypothetical protein